MTMTIPDVDLADGSFYADGHARDAYRWMRTHQPLFRDRNGLPAVTTYAGVIEAERNPELFSNAGGIRPDQAAYPHMVDMDDPAHLMRRKLVNTGFTRKRVTEKMDSIEEICDLLIDNVCEKGECDFVRDLAAPLPMAVIGDMLGVAPHERAKLLAWSDDLVTILSSKVSEAALSKAAEAYAGYVTYVRPKLEERRDNPADDLLSVLTHAEVEGQKLTDDEILSETLLILLAGDETTRHTLSGGTEQLLRNYDQWEQLQDSPDLLPGALEEMLRWTSPVKNMCRTVTEDTEFLGVALSKSEKVMLMFESANFDEEMFGDPDTFRINRDPNNHLAFGFGTHFCLGNQLARLEITLMTRKLIERLPDIRLAGDSALPLRPANFVSGLEAMPVVFTPARPLH